MMTSPLQALHRAAEILGSQAALARAIGRTQQAVNGVFSRGAEPPAEWCLPIERATGGKVTRHELRPDIYPVETQAAE